MDTESESPQQENERKKYALVVGVNQSTHMPNFPAPLRHAERGAAGIAYLLGRETCNFAFPSGFLIGEAANTHNVRRAMNTLIDSKSENDLLLFYFVGHGYSMKVSPGRVETYLVTSDFDPNLSLAEQNPEAYLSLSEIRRILYEHQTRANVICIVDCCHAGAIVEPPPPEQQLTQALKAFVQNTVADIAQATTSPDRTCVILTSTGPETSSYERVFTGLIINMLNGDIRHALDHDGNLTLLTLYHYLQQMPRPEEQQPVMDGRFGSSPWVLAYHAVKNRIRRGPDDFPGPPQSPQIPAMIQHFDMLSSSAVYHDLDISQVEDFLQKERVLLQKNYQADPSKEGLIQALGLMRGEFAICGTLLCFGQKLFLSNGENRPASHTRCIYWNDITRRGTPHNHDNEKFEENLLYQFTKARSFLEKHLGGIRANGRSKRLEIPFRVLEEALANALVHREYITITERGQVVRTEGVRVEIFSDRVEITSPGGPPAELDGKSHPRNSQIMRIFYLAGYVEELGTGITRMHDWMQEAGLREPDITASQQTFTIILYGSSLPSAPLTKIVTGPPVYLPDLGGMKTQPDGVKPIIEMIAQMDDITARRPAVSPIPPRPQPSKNNLISQIQVLVASLPPTPVVVIPPITHLIDQEQVPFPGPPSNGHSSPNPPDTPKQDLVNIYNKSKLLTTAVIIALIIGFIIGAGTMDSYIYFGGHLPTIITPEPAASTTIEIASDFPTSGLDTTDGLPLQNGVQMAITEANNGHLLPTNYALKAVLSNDVGSGNLHDPKVGADNLTKAIADNLIAGVIGPGNSSVAQKELPIANQAPLALLSPDVTFSCLTKSTADDPNCTGINDIAIQMRPTTNQLTFFRLATTDNRQGKAAADYFAQHHSKVLLLKDDSDPYSFGLAQAFQVEWKQTGGQVIPVDFPQSVSSVQDYQNTLQAVALTQPDLIYFAGNDPNSSYVLQALSTIALLKTVPFAGGDGIMDSGLLQTAANLHWAAPIYVSLPTEDPTHSKTSIGSNFATNYTENGYEYYRPYAAAAYDCTMMLIQAINKALKTKGVSTPYGTQDHAGAVKFRQAVLDALRKLPAYTGATGTHSFDANGDTTNHTISFYQADLSTPQPSWMWLGEVKA